MSQYNSDASKIETNKDGNNVYAALEYELYKKRISFVQFCICYYIRAGIPPVAVPLRVLLEQIRTDCFCHKMSDRSDSFYLNEEDFKIRINERFSEWAKWYESKDRISEKSFFQQNHTVDYEEKLKEAECRGWRDAILTMIRTKFSCGDFFEKYLMGIKNIADLKKLVIFAAESSDLSDFMKKANRFVSH